MTLASRLAFLAISLAGLSGCGVDLEELICGRDASGSMPRNRPAWCDRDRTPPPMPPPSGSCSGLGESACNARPDCTAVYDGQTYGPLGAPSRYLRCEGVSVCAAAPCPGGCQYGFKLDSAGCQVCECNQPPVCPSTACDLYCEFGEKRGVGGCTLCQCNPGPSCPEPTCALYCQNGFKLDASGCNVCECNP